MDFHTQSNISFIRHKIHELEKFTEKKRPFTRLVFSKEFYEARVWLKNEYLKLGLSVSTDEAYSNIVRTLHVILVPDIHSLRQQGHDTSLACILTKMQTQLLLWLS